MKKYWLLLKNQIGLITNYRVELFGRWFMNLFEVIVYYSLWRLTAKGNPEKTKQIFTYFVLLYGLLQNTQTTRAARWMAEDILSGNVSTYFIKPITFPFTVIIKSFTTIASRIILPAIIISLGIIFAPDYFAPNGILSLLTAALIAFLGLVFWNQLMVFIGAIAFWGTEIESLAITVNLILNLVKGAYIPAYLFPNKIKNLLNLTPFNYLVALPIETYQNPLDLSLTIKRILIIIFWIIIFGLFLKWFYKKALKHYQVFGG